MATHSASRRNGEGKLLECSVTVAQKDDAIPNKVQLLIVIQIANQRHCIIPSLEH